MRFSLQREVFLKPLAQVVNVVERRQTLPVLANLLVQVKGGLLSLTGTDLEVEMVARHAIEDAQDGETTIPARKLFEIVRALPDGSKVTVSQTGDKVTVQAGRSRFTLASLPANDFPSVDEMEATERVRVSERVARPPGEQRVAGEEMRLAALREQEAHAARRVTGCVQDLELDPA